MSNLFYRNPRLLVLTLAMIAVGGLSSYYVLPRMEDPLLTQRVAMITTRFPGADAERVESSVSEVLEDALQEIDEIKELRSVSRRGMSSMTIELRDDIYEVATVWSRIRDKIGDAKAELPDGAAEPVFDQLEVKAYAVIVGLIWDSPSNADPNQAIMRRMAKRLEDQLLAVSGTEKVDTFGAPSEEVLVQIDASNMVSLGLDASDVSNRIAASDAKASAGQFRGQDDFLLEVSGEFKTLERISNIPLQQNGDGSFVRLSDIASIEKGIQRPQSTAVLIDGKPAIALGVLVRPAMRVDLWSAQAMTTIAEFSDSLPRGIRLQTVFQQNEYVESRLATLMLNLVLAAVAITVVILLMMGWRSAIVVGLALPLAALMVLSGMRFMEIPIHQMSVTGLIIALGLLIDNAIVIVDEVNGRLANGSSAHTAVSESVSHLALPLFGSTVTTALAFAPIALMPGPAGEFVGSIAVSVILAIFSSLFLALTIVPAIAAFVRSDLLGRTSSNAWWRIGLRFPLALDSYRGLLEYVFQRPALGIALGVSLPILGFLQFPKLPEQFFPPGDRNQFQLELELGSQTSLQETLARVQTIRNRILQHPQVADVSWFVGESAPSFYYNVIPRRRNTSNYAQALVQLHPDVKPLPVIRTLQPELNEFAPDCRLLARQLEQGPPFDAPVELRLFGPDLQVLRELGNQLRQVLSQSEHVVHTRSDLSDTVVSLSFNVDEEEARIAGLNHTSIAQQLNDSLEGSIGGSVLEETEELPVRVRVSNDDRSNMASIRSLDLVSSTDSQSIIPLSALGKVSLEAQSASIPRFNRERMNEVQAYTTAGILPATVLQEFRESLANSNFQLPPSYRMEWGGEAAKRDDAIGNLMANIGTLLVMMVATLVLSFGSFRMAGIIGAVAALSVGLGVGALWVFGYPFGFMAIVGTMGLIGIAINDAIVVLAAIREDARARDGDPQAVREVVLRSTRHVLATSLTTVAGFIPLLVSGGGFWPPLAVSIAGGVGGATILALLFAPSAYIALMCKSCEQHETVEYVEEDSVVDDTSPQQIPALQT